MAMKPWPTLARTTALSDVLDATLTLAGWHSIVRIVMSHVAMFLQWTWRP
jgi:hypothetical protein